MWLLPIVETKCISSSMSRIFLLVLLLGLSIVPSEAQQTIEGYVYSDVNRNGRRDRQEAGIAGIPVSNGKDVVLTNDKGKYKLCLAEGFSVFPILPSDYTLSTGKVVNSHFRVSFKKGEGNPDFGLRRKAVKQQFRLNAIGDVQVGNYQELDYAAKTLWPELLNTDSTDVNLFLGDLVNNNLSLYAKLKEMMELLPSQTWTVIGNHDRDADSIRRGQTKTYSTIFGSDVYAFNEGKVHFIVLNNVYGDGAKGYHGELPEEALEFVKNDVRLVPQDYLICLSMHIPLAMTKNRNALLDILKDRKEVLAITGHLHRVMRFFYGRPGVHVHELGAGATCGFWWVGEKDWEGVPTALQQGGTPRNYFVLDFTGNSYSLRCKGVGLDAHRQMSIHVTGIDTLDTHLRDMEGTAPYQALLTIWGGCDSTEVKCRVDGGAWRMVRKTDAIDPNVARTREMNLQKVYPTHYNRVNPMRRTPSPQLWTFPLPASARSGAHRIEVQASDGYGFRASGQRVFVYE